MDDHIHQSNLIEGIDDPREDKQSMSAWLWLLQQKKLDHGVICHLQKRITLHQTDLQPDQRGYYRKLQVYIGDRVPVHHSMVKMLMDNWLLDYRKLGPLEAHIKFETVHPFVDGNGRTGRMLMWWQELHEGALPTLFENEHKWQDYYPLFS
jgi:hypothetical protein